jgi:hypothetical protein
VIGQIRAHWPDVRIVLRADSGFARDPLMSWCESNNVDYLFGLAKNDRLIAKIIDELVVAGEESQQTGKPARRFKDFTYKTHKSWGRARRVVGKAEWMTASAAEINDQLLGDETGAAKKKRKAKTPARFDRLKELQGRGNPRFIVTSLQAVEYPAQSLYEDIYCARGEMENRIKECQLDLFADRTSSHTMRANQLRLWLAAMAYVLLEGLRRIGLAGTHLANATCASIRLKLLKIGALVRISVRRVKFAMASAFPYVGIFKTVWAALEHAAP